MRIVKRVAAAVQTVFTSLSREVGQSSGVIKRQRKFDASTLAQTLVFGFLQNPRAKDEDLARMAAVCGVPVTPQAIEQRFTWVLGRFLRELLEATVKEVIKAPPVLIPLLKKFNGVYVHDSSTIALPQEMAEHFPGCGGDGSSAALKVQTRIELTAGQLSYIGFEPGRSPDQGSAIQEAQLPEGSLRLADLGYFALPTLVLLARMRVNWISRIQSSIAVFDAKGQPLDLQGWLQTNATHGPVEREVQLGVAERLTCRLIGFAAPPEIVARRRQQLYKDAARKGRVPSVERLAWCQWTVFVTNVPASILSAKEIIVLYRARWQIELLFKLWKSHGLVAALTSHKPARQAAEVFARLLAVIIQHWLLLASVWSYPDRSLVKAVAGIRAFVATVAASLKCKTRLIQILEMIGTSLVKTARMNKRKRKPNSYQLLLNPDLLEYEFATA
jgi:hypothetical protein